jgi:hypothetical protein
MKHYQVNVWIGGAWALDERYIPLAKAQARKAEIESRGMKAQVIDMATKKEVQS